MLRMDDAIESAIVPMLMRGIPRSSGRPCRPMPSIAVDIMLPGEAGSISGERRKFA